jgi:hypothetical protein
MGDHKFIYYLELLRALEGMLSRRSRLHLQVIAPTNQHWARLVGYGQNSLSDVSRFDEVK